MTLDPRTQSTDRSSSLCAPDALARAVGGGLAAVSMIVVNLGCGCSGVLDDEDFSWGCLVEADVSGEPAQAEAQTTTHGTTVRLSQSGPDARGAVITLPGRMLETLPLGELPLDAQVELDVCAGDAVTACVPTRDVVIEVVDLGDGTARASFTATSLDASGRERPVEGTFVFARHTDEGI